MNFKGKVCAMCKSGLGVVTFQGLEPFVLSHAGLYTLCGAVCRHSNGFTLMCDPSSFSDSSKILSLRCMSVTLGVNNVAQGGSVLAMTGVL